MANKKYKLSEDYWETSGVYDIAESKTQRQINSDLKSGKVPTTRTVNSKALSANITLNASDIPNDSTVSGTNVDDALDNLKGAINSQQGQISAYIQTSTTASRAYAKGDYFVLNGVLYRVTTAIANGGTITIGTNAIATNVGAELNTTIKTLGFLKAGLSITGASTIGSFTLPAGEWLFLERVYASAAGEVALTINGGVSLHTNALNGSYVYGFNLATTNANTTFTYGTNSWTTATIGQLYVEVIPLLETRTSFS